MHTEVALPSEKIMTILRNYSWPGNVRELRNVIEGAVALSENDEINVWDIPDYIVQSRQQGRRQDQGKVCMADFTKWRTT